MGCIRVETDSALGIITLDDPAGGNRLHPEALAALREGARVLVDDPGVRAVLLRSSGDPFCLGMDLERLGGADDASRAAGIEGAVGDYVRLLDGIHDSPKPFIAAVEGAVKAGGVGLVSACDVVVATERASFELGEAFFGIIPANVLPFLLSVRIPLQKARYLILTGRTLSAREALTVGIVDELLGEAEAERGLRELLKRMWRTSPAAVAEAKSFTRELLGLDAGEAKSRARRKLQEMLEGGEALGAVRSFNEGGTPPWFGKFRPSRPLLVSAGRSPQGGAP